MCQYFYFFLLLNNILCVDLPHFMNPLTHGYLGCFCFLVIMTNAAVNVCVQVFVWIRLSCFQSPETHMIVPSDTSGISVCLQIIYSDGKSYLLGFHQMGLWSFPQNPELPLTFMEFGALNFKAEFPQRTGVNRESRVA